MKTSITLLLVLLSLICFGLPSTAPGVSPPPDGGYSGGNTAEGQNALLSLTSGTYNTAVGLFSLLSNGEGNFNTAAGAGALLANTADENTAVGAGALLSNTTGFANTGDGAFALFSSTTGALNTATGARALFNNTTGEANTADGRRALHTNTEGSHDTAVGFNALFGNFTGDNNTAVGSNALLGNITGDNNTALGHRAGENITGSGNVCIGQEVLGESGGDDSTYIRNINTTTQSFSAGVNDYVTVRLTDGRLGHTIVVSSQRYKEDIKPLAATSQALYALKPVSFRLKKEYDEAQPLGFGLIAEEVEKVNAAMVYRNNKGQVESVRYEMVNAMLLNEFLKEHEAFLEEQEKGKEQDRKLQEQEMTIAQLKKQMKSVLVRLKEHDSEIQRVRDQTKINSTPAQFVLRNH